MHNKWYDYLSKGGRIMPRNKVIINAEVARRAQESLEGIRDRKLVIKLQSIISSATYPIKDVSRILGVGRQSVRNWILSFRAHGIAGLYDKPRGHRRSKLSDAEWAEVADWLERVVSPEGDPCHWTLERLRETIESRFTVRLGLTPLWRQVRKMGFRLKTPRPVHAKADPQKQADFKKNF